MRRCGRSCCVWLPDRPGAGSRRQPHRCSPRRRAGDRHPERGGGQVVDELVVSLPAGTPQELLIAEVGAVDDVAVESVRETPSDRPDPALSLFELGAQVAEACAGGTPIRSRCSAGASALLSTPTGSSRWEPTASDSVTVCHPIPAGSAHSSMAAGTSHPRATTVLPT